jgi:alkanesulfonate monooxygenase
VTGAQGNSTALVGTPDEVVDVPLDDHDLGFSALLIRGFDPYEDAVQYGRGLIPASKHQLADRRLAATAAE